MSIEVEIENMFNVSCSIAKKKESEQIIIINNIDFIKMLDLEFTTMSVNDDYFDIKFKINQNDCLIGEVEVILCTNNYSEDILYDEWFEKDYSMGMIALSIINQNLYYKFEKYKRIAIISYFKLYKAELRGNSSGSKALSIIEELLKKFFKIDVIYLYSQPLDLSYNAKLYQEYIEESLYDNDYLFNELNEYESEEAIHEYEILRKKVDNFYICNNMKYLDTDKHTFYKEI